MASYFSTTKDSPVVALRLSPAENDALSALLAEQQRLAKQLGFAGVVTPAGYLRSLLQREAEAKGVWPSEAPAVPEPAPEAEVKVEPAPEVKAEAIKQPTLPFAVPQPVPAPEVKAEVVEAPAVPEVKVEPAPEVKLTSVALVARLRKAKAVACKSQSAVSVALREVVGETILGTSQSAVSYWLREDDRHRPIPEELLPAVEQVLAKWGF